MSVNVTKQRLNISVADLVLTLDARNTEIHLKLPDSCHYPFLVDHTAEVSHTSAVSESLLIKVDNVTTLSLLPKDHLISQNSFFSVYCSPGGDLTIFAERESLPFLLNINPNFSSGTIEGRFLKNGVKDIYPLQSMGIVLYANWLAQFGDLILHAAGIAVNGKGFAFIGPSGAGKSTLMKHVLSQNSGIVLGEDQVVLRFIHDRFWIYGTPWHERPEMCDPVSVPLERLFFLDRNQRQVTLKISAIAGVQRLLQTAFIPFYRADRIPLILDQLAKLSEHVPFYSLAYCLGTDILSIILNTQAT